MHRSLFVGVGANLTSSRFGTPIDTCRWAISRVVSICRSEFVSISSWYRTAAVPASDQPDFINGVIKLDGPTDPGWLLQQLHIVEVAAGRVRSIANAARVLDLDLLAVGDIVLDEPGLILPHPRLAERAFVLQPLCDIAPDWRHPVLGETAAALRDRLPPQRIERVPDTTEDLLWRARALR